MRTGTIFKRYELFVAAAVIAAHANGPKDGFRQRDVRFLIELFSNWVEASFESKVLTINNTQVLRYLEELVHEGFARRIAKKDRPNYRLTRTGLIELLTRLIPQSLHIQPEHFFFLYYFIANYKPRIQRLIEEEGKRFPLAMKLEVEGLLDSKTLLEQQIRYAELELKKLDGRIKDAEQGSVLASKLADDSLSLSEIATAIEKKYPYELNSRKPLTELMQEIPPDLGIWELTTGSERRVTHIWGPQREMLVTYLGVLKRLAS